MSNYLTIILRGVGQVMLQNNALTGLLFLVGIFYNSWLMGLGALLGNIASTVSARLLKYPAEDIKNGLYGFNGTLVGVATWYFFGFNLATTLAIVLGAAFSTVIMRTMQKKFPAYTAPFVISTWIVIFGIKFLGLAPLVASVLPPANSLNLFSAISLGFGQVMFQADIVTGLIFLLAILINSRLAAIYALYGSLLGGLFALLFSLPFNMINFGLFGYNAVLCAIALGDKKRSAFLLTTVTVCIAVLINFGLGEIGVIALTAPFVLATWLMLIIKKHNFKERTI